MSVSYVGVNGNEWHAGGINNFNCSKPSGMAEGDLVVMTCLVGRASVTGDPTVLTPPPNFTRVWVDDFNTAANRMVSVAYKWVTSSEPTYYTWSLSSGYAQNWISQVQCYRGVCANNPVGTLTVNEYQTGPVTKQFTAPELTVPTDGCMLYAGLAIIYQGTTFTPPSSPYTFTKVRQDTSGAYISMASAYHIWAGGDYTDTGNNYWTYGDYLGRTQAGWCFQMPVHMSDPLCSYWTPGWDGEYPGAGSSSSIELTPEQEGHRARLFEYSRDHRSKIYLPVDRAYSRQRGIITTD